MPIFGGGLGEGKTGTQRHGGTRDGQTPQGMKGKWAQTKGGEGGSALVRETAADAGMRRREQGRTVEAIRWWVWAMSGWYMLCTR